MRNDVKLGLAVGGLLLGVVLAYALFFSNTNKDRNSLTDGGYSALNNSDAATQRQPAPQGTDLAPTDSNQQTNPAPPATADHQGGSNNDPAPANALIGKSWQLLLNEGATANNNTTLPPPIDRGIIQAPPTRDIPAHDPPSRQTTTLAEPPPHPAGPRRYTIKSGETFWSIAKAEYGNAAYYPHIQRANPSVDPGRVKAGDSIILPDKSEVVAANTVTTVRQPSAAELVNLDPTKQYRVQPGDNLHSISKKLYGRFDKWAQIYELNKDLIGPNPAALKRDMILALPEPPLRVAATIQ